MQIQLSPKLMKIAHKIVQVPEMKFLLRPFIHNVKRNNQYIIGAVRKKISKAFRYNNHQCLIQELCIQIKIYTRKNRNLCLSEDLKC